jgi:hypothetical protein
MTLRAKEISMRLPSYLKAPLFLLLPLFLAGGCGGHGGMTQMAMMPADGMM